jgi:hypothetical protein
MAKEGALSILLSVLRLFNSICELIVRAYVLFEKFQPLTWIQQANSDHVVSKLNYFHGCQDGQICRIVEYHESGVNCRCSSWTFDISDFMCIMSSFELCQTSWYWLCCVWLANFNSLVSIRIDASSPISLVQDQSEYL